MRDFSLVQLFSSHVRLHYHQRSLLLDSISLQQTVRMCRLALVFHTLRKHAYSNILKISPPKNENFQIKKSVFHISAQNIDCGYSLEPPRRGGSNEYTQSMFLDRNKKNNVYSCKPQFYYIKVGFKGVKIIKHVFVMNFILPKTPFLINTLHLILYIIFITSAKLSFFRFTQNIGNKICTMVFIIFSEIKESIHFLNSRIFFPVFNPKAQNTHDAFLFSIYTNVV